MSSLMAVRSDALAWRGGEKRQNQGTSRWVPDLRLFAVLHDHCTGVCLTNRFIFEGVASVVPAAQPETMRPACLTSDSLEDPSRPGHHP